MGYGHIAGPHAEAVQKFYTAHFNPYLNLPSAVRVRDDKLQRARQTDAALQGRRLPDTLREAEVAAGSRTISQAGGKLCDAGPDRAPDERYRMCAEDGRGQNQTAAAMQNGVAVSAGPPIKKIPGARRAVEMTGWWKAGKSGSRISPSFHFPPPLGNPATTARFPHSHRSGNES
jgi:hypothetical protein